MDKRYAGAMLIVGALTLNPLLIVLSILMGKYVKST